MATNSASPGKDLLKKPNPLAPLKRFPVASSDSAMGALKSAKFGGAAKSGKASGSLSSVVKKAEECGTHGSVYSRPKSTLMKPTLSSSASCLPTRSNTGGMSEKRAVPSPNRSFPVGRKVSPSASDSGNKHSIESRQASLPLASSKNSMLDASLHLLSNSATGKADSMRRSTNKPSKTVPSSRIVSPTSPKSSNDRIRFRKTNSTLSSSSGLSPSGASSLKLGSLPAVVNIVSSLPGRKKYPLTAESHDSNLIMLPQVDVKAGDDIDQQLEESPILQMLHVEDASILLVDPTLKKFDDRETPRIFSLKIVGEGIEGTTLHAEKKCWGEEKGDSIYHWFLTSPDGTMIEIEGAKSASYKVSCNDIGFLISVSCDPVSSDWVCGSTLTSRCIGPIVPGPPICHSLEFLGSMVEGNHLSFVASYSGGGKGNCIHEWFRLSESGNKEKLSDDVFLDLTFEDVGRCIELVYTPVREDGLRGYKKSLISTSVAPGMPKIGKLEIEGRGFHTNLYAVRGIYSGGKEGKSKIQWLRSIIGSPDLISIPGEVGLMYEANVDDVGYRLVVIYTPVREDGVEGEAVSTSTEPIAVEPDLNREMKQKLEIGSMKFEVLIDKDSKVPGAGNLERRILEVNRKRIKVVKPGSKTSFPATEIKGTYAPPFHVVLYRNDQHHFKIVVDRENEVELMLQTRQMRDIIVLVIRGLAQRFNSVSLNSLLRVDN